MPKRIVKFREFRGVMQKIDRCNAIIQQQLNNVLEGQLEVFENLETLHILFMSQAIMETNYHEALLFNPCMGDTELETYMTTMGVKLPYHAMRGEGPRNKTYGLRYDQSTQLNAKQITKLIKLFSRKQKAATKRYKGYRAKSKAQKLKR